MQESTATNDAAATHNSQLAITNASALTAMTNERNAAVMVHRQAISSSCIVDDFEQMSETMTNERNAAVMVWLMRVCVLTDVLCTA
jgi:hypothetical protein